MTRGPILLLAALSLVTATACKREDRNRGRAAVAPQLPPLVSHSPTASLSVTGFGDAVVALPTGATQETPVVVAVLGIGDSPEEQCATWRELVASRAFVLCPRGAKHFVRDEPEGEDGGTADRDTNNSSSDDPPPEEGEEQGKEEKPSGRVDGGRIRQVGFYPVDVPTLEREVIAGLAALKARWGAHVADRAVVYAGFSRAAFLGASLAAKRPDRFSRVVLVEGGHTPWQPDTAAAFARGGGKRVLFVCGQPKCVEDSEPVAAMLRAQKLETRVVHAVGEGHGYRFHNPAKEELRRSIQWVTEGDPTWQTVFAK
jgi:hypothetical protein